MFYGIFDMLKRDLIMPNSTILAIHTGGTQGIEGMNERIKSKGWKIDF
jgi:1-aminocyclopropane-1-carboxylate deaminase